MVLEDIKMILVSLNIKVYYFTFLTTPYFGHQTEYSDPRIRCKVAANSQINTKHINTVGEEHIVVEC